MASWESVAPSCTTDGLTTDNLACVRRLHLAGTITAATTACLVATSAVFATWGVRTPLPATSGEVAVPGLSAPTTVTRDALGVPYVTATRSSDMFYAQGYATAQDRMLQMDIARRRALGKLAALVGPQNEALASDTLARTLGIENVARTELAELTPATRAALTAYADGVNAYLRDRRLSDVDVQYSILGQVVELSAITPWEPAHSLALVKWQGFQSVSNLHDELARSAAYATTRDVSAVEALYPRYPTMEHPPVMAVSETPLAREQQTQNATRRPPPAAVASAHNSGQATDAARQLLSDAGMSRPKGLSAAVAVSGKITASGKPLLGNDPHGELTLPNDYMQVGLACKAITDDCPYTVTGFATPGVPGVWWGKTPSSAWALTSSGADTADLFVERLKGDEVLRDGNYEPLVSRKETIHVAGETPRDLTVYETVHGPLITRGTSLGYPAISAPAAVVDGDDEEIGVALAWAGLRPSRTMDGLLAMMQAASWTEFHEAARFFDDPAPGITFVDDANTISFQVTGKIPVRGSADQWGSDGTWPRPGWESSWDWKGWRDYDSLPYVVNPSDGYIIAANQLPVDGGAPTGQDVDYGYRSNRLRTLLNDRISQGKVSGGDVESMFGDLHDQIAPHLVPYLLDVPLDGGTSLTRAEIEFVDSARSLLRSWNDDGAVMDKDSAGAAYFAAVYSRLLQLTFGDEPGMAVSPDGNSRWGYVLRGLMDKPTDPWWDNKSTPAVVEQRDQILVKALVEARMELTAGLGKQPTSWTWGALHTHASGVYPLGADKAAWWTRKLLTTPQQQLPGSFTTVRLTGWDAATARDFSVTRASLARSVASLSAQEESRWNIYGGASGHRASGHLFDQTPAWLDAGTSTWRSVAADIPTEEAAELLLVPSPTDEVDGTPATPTE